MTNKPPSGWQMFQSAEMNNSDAYEKLGALLSDLDKLISNYEYVNAFYPNNSKAKRGKLAPTITMRKKLRRALESIGIDNDHSKYYQYDEFEFGLKLDED